MMRISTDMVSQGEMLLLFVRTQRCCSRWGHFNREVRGGGVYFLRIIMN
jgi:hypothetical protein